MAKQKGVIKIAGKLDDLSFYQQDGQYFARMKGGVSGDRIKTDPNFVRVRENNAEFGRATKGSKVVLDAYKLLTKGVATRKTRSSMNKLMMIALHADATNARGERTLQNGDISVLNGFDINRNEHLGSTLILDYDVSIDRSGGTLGVSTADFVPKDSLNWPEGATHVKFVAGGAELDFANGTFIRNIAESDIIPIDDSTATGLALDTTVTAASTLPLMLVFGVFFYQELNGVNYPLRNGQYNAVAIVGIDLP